MKDTSTRRQDILAYSAIGLFALVLIIILFHGIPESTLAGTLLGSASSLVLMVYSFYFGSSKSSQAKDETIAAQLQPDKPTQQ